MSEQTSRDDIEELIEPAFQDAAIQCVADQGSGRAFVMVSERGVYRRFGDEMVRALSERTRAVEFEIPSVSERNWGALSRALRGALAEKSVRQCSLVGFGAASAIVQQLLLLEPKLVRTLTLVDGASRAHPSLLMKIADKLEAFLPLGLPLRLKKSGFDSKPFLQRMRCPVLIVSTAQSSAYIKQQAELLSQRIPTSWRCALKSGDQASELSKLILEFEEVPAKCPQ